MERYVPSKGDFVVVSFDPQTGHQRRGRRPALVVSNTLFNARTGLALVCPLTTTDRGYPFHVKVSDDPAVSGFVMVDQVKLIDYRARKAKRIATSSLVVLDEVLSILDACLY